MGKEFNDEFEQFMTNIVGVQQTPLGQLVKHYLESPMVERQRPEMPIFPGKDWGTYEVRDNNNGIFDGGWAHILVIEDYEWEKHSYFRSTFSNTMPFLSDKFSSKPLVIFIGKNNDGFNLIDHDNFYEIDVNDSFGETKWAYEFSKLFVSNPAWLEGAKEGIVDSFKRRIEDKTT